MNPPAGPVRGIDGRTSRLRPGRRANRMPSGPTQPSPMIDRSRPGPAVPGRTPPRRRRVRAAQLRAGPRADGGAKNPLTLRAAENSLPAGHHPSNEEELMKCTES